MKLEERFREISLFLNQHKFILDLEILKRYPKNLPDYFKGWIDQIESYSEEDLVYLENNFKAPRPLSLDLEDYLKKIQSLSQVEKKQSEETLLPKNLIPKINRKKKHEIQILKTIVDKMDKVENILDIGSGAGHLSSFLVDKKPIKSICLDKNLFFQEQGKKRLSKYAPENLEKIHFIGKIFKNDSYLDKITPATLVLGLHSCGELSSDIIEFYKGGDFSHLINIGCCYQDLNGRYNLSKMSKESPLVFTKNTLHLAARSYSHTNLELMRKKIQVRNFRYALHFFLSDKGQEEFAGIGNGKKTDYSTSFAKYAKKFCPKQLDIVSDDYLNDYFLNEKTQRGIKRVILGDILRGLMGRLVELYLVCDRAIFLKEQIPNVYLEEIFDRKISPRNLCIYAERNLYLKTNFI